MTIRYKCQECGSVLKIKDELAGTDGRCPKCKREFVVPAPTEGAGAPGDSSPAGGADFDPVAFLMDDAVKPAPSASSPVAAPQPPRQQAAGPSAPAEAPPERPKRSRAPTGESAAESAGAMLGGTASTNAKQLLTRSMEESRVRAAEMPEDREEPEVDYSDFIRLMTTRILPGGVVVILLCIGLYMMSWSWFNEGLPELGRVSGVVTRAGEPLPGAQVTFTPLDIRASSATAITEENGEYELYYQEGVRGAVVGKNRVHVFVLDERGRELIEADTPYGPGSNEVHIVESGSQRIDIDTDRPAAAAAGE